MSVNSSESGSLSQRLRNFVVVAVAIGLTIAVVLGLQTRTPTASLTAMAESSTPLLEATSNGRPTMIEFYANWCTSCQAMAGELQQLKQTYGQDINFVMLNVDNNKWLPEMLHYNVDGIPHFAFLDRTGNDVGSSVGEVPKTVLAANLQALAQDEILPVAQATGETSRLDNGPAAAGSQTDPRSHGAQVVM